ncbi:hypothetical protein [Halosimplex sp. J119]
MAEGHDSRVRLADEVAGLMYGAAGWLLVWLGLIGIVTVVGRALGGTMYSVEPAAVVLALSLVALVAGVAVNPRFERRHRLTRFGRAPVVERRAIRPDEGSDEPCVVCDDPVESGLCRRYREETVVAGVTVATSDGEENYYCLDCAASELGLDVDGDADDKFALDSRTDESERLADPE